jgi:hypothetical protein
MAEKPTPPLRLGDRALGLWRGITDKYSLRVDELYILESACREIDLIDKMEAEQKTSDLVVFGSQGQPVAAPLIAELRQHRTTFANFMKQLKLPDEDGRAAEAVSDAARKAANARWGRSG